MPRRLVADPAQDNLLHLHGRPALCGKNGAAGNPTAGSAGPLCARPRAHWSTLRIAWSTRQASAWTLAAGVHACNAPCQC